MRPSLYLALLLALLAALTLSCRKDRPDDRPTDPPESRTKQQATAADLQLPDHIRRGVSFAHVWQDDGRHGYGTDDSRATLRHLADLGVDTVSVTPFGWMPSLSATSVRGEHDSELPDGGEHRDALAEVIEQARTHDIEVVLKPHIWIRGGKWRGEIAPTDDGDPAWEAWWASYREFLLYYAEFAEHNDVETLVAGVELKSAVEARPEALRELVDDIREVYDRRVTYAANWDADLPDDLWREFDAVGVQMYPPLTDQPDPDLATLRENLRPHLAEWNRLAARVNRPLEILEVGYKSAASAAAKPWGWPEDLAADRRTPDPALQARAYTALFAELRNLSELRSVHVWKYFTDPTRDEGGELGFSPRDKPAEAVLEKAYGKVER
jgi:hypothetical protein